MLSLTLDWSTFYTDWSSLWFSSVPPGKYGVSIWTIPRPYPSKSFSITQTPYQTTLQSLDTKVSLNNPPAGKSVTLSFNVRSSFYFFPSNNLYSLLRIIYTSIIEGESRYRSWIWSSQGWWVWKVFVFLDVTPCSIADLIRHFGIMYCLYLQSRRVRQAGIHQ